nr:hypothetical protein I308_02743 [Cryptococcus tetragattii IND107]
MGTSAFEREEMGVVGRGDALSQSQNLSPSQRKNIEGPALPKDEHPIRNLRTQTLQHTTFYPWPLSYYDPQLTFSRSCYRFKNIEGSKRPGTDRPKGSISLSKGSPLDAPKNSCAMPIRCGID